MKNSLKAVILAGLIAASSIASAESPDDNLCLAIAGYAGSVAKGKASGRTEETANELATDQSIKKQTTRIIAFVYTMDLSPEEARKLVYLKCMGSGFGVPDRK